MSFLPSSSPRITFPPKTDEEALDYLARGRESRHQLIPSMGSQGLGRQTSKSLGFRSGRGPGTKRQVLLSSGGTIAALVRPLSIAFRRPLNSLKQLDEVALAFVFDAKRGQVILKLSFTFQANH